MSKIRGYIQGITVSFIRTIKNLMLHINRFFPPFFVAFVLRLFRFQILKSMHLRFKKKIRAKPLVPHKSCFFPPFFVTFCVLSLKFIENYVIN